MIDFELISPVVKKILKRLLNPQLTKLFPAHYESYLHNQQTTSMEMLTVPPPISNEPIEEPTHSSNMGKTPKMRSNSKVHKAAKFSNDTENYDSAGRLFLHREPIQPDTVAGA